MEEKKNFIKSNAEKPQQENKDFKDQEHVHKVISHEEINKKEKPTKNATPHVDVKTTRQPRATNKHHDYLNSAYGKKLKRIAPHPGPSLVNHTPFPGVIFKDTNLGVSGSNPHLTKLRRILPAPQKPSFPPSPANSPSKLLEHLTQQANLSILSSLYADKTPTASACSSQKPAPAPSSAPPTTATAPARNRKTPPSVKRTISFEETIPQTVRQLNCDNEVVAKTPGTELSDSPVKEKLSKSWLVHSREKEGGSHGEELSVTFVITSDEGIRIEAGSCEGILLCYVLAIATFDCCFYLLEHSKHFAADSGKDRMTINNTLRNCCSVSFHMNCHI